MAAKDYGCSYCKVIFTNNEPERPKDKADMKCPYCGTSHVERLDTLSDRLRFINSMAPSYG